MVCDDIKKTREKLFHRLSRVFRYTFRQRCVTHIPLSGGCFMLACRILYDSFIAYPTLIVH